jgi:hypothetical protein
MRASRRDTSGTDLFRDQIAVVDIKSARFWVCTTGFLTLWCPWPGSVPLLKGEVAEALDTRRRRLNLRSSREAVMQEMLSHFMGVRIGYFGVILDDDNVHG